MGFQGEEWLSLYHSRTLRPLLGKGLVGCWDSCITLGGMTTSLSLFGDQVQFKEMQMAAKVTGAGLVMVNFKCHVTGTQAEINHYFWVCL